MISISNFELVYWGDDGTSFVVPLEEWQMQAIHQLLGFTFEETSTGVQISQFSKDTVSKRLKKMGILVTPDQYTKLNSIESNQ